MFRELFEDKLIFEMSNLNDRHHGLSKDIKLNVLQPGDKQIKHGLRVKVMKSSHDYVTITIDLENGVAKAINKEKWFKGKLQKNTLKFIENNIENINGLWNDQFKDPDDFEWKKELE